MEGLLKPEAVAEAKADWGVDVGWPNADCCRDPKADCPKVDPKADVDEDCLLPCVLWFVAA